MASGEDVLDQLGMGDRNKWEELGKLAALAFLFRFMVSLYSLLTLVSISDK